MQTTPHILAAELAQSIANLPPFIAATMRRCYEIANTPSKEQAIMNALPDYGITARQAVAVYTAMYSALNALGLASGLSAPDTNKFVVNPDDTVTVVIPEVVIPNPPTDPTEAP